MQKWFVLVLLAALFVLVGGCTDNAPAEQPSAPPPTPTVNQAIVPQTPIGTPAPVPVTTLTISTNTVTITDNTFNPAELTVKAGSQVRWVNADDHPHRVSFASGGFTAFLLGAGQSSSQVFNRQGVYDYTCLVIPGMHGTVTVVE